MIRGYILVHPGDSYTDIKQNLKLSSGALTYHLDVLEREKLVKSQNRGSRKLCYPAGVPVPEDGGGLHELQLRMLKGRGGAAGDPAAGPRGDPGGEPGARPVPPAHAPDAAVGGDAARRAVHPGVRRGGGGAEGGHVIWTRSTNRWKTPGLLPPPIVKVFALSLPPSSFRDRTQGCAGARGSDIRAGDNADAP